MANLKKIRTDVAASLPRPAGTEKGSGVCVLQNLTVVAAVVAVL